MTPATYQLREYQAALLNRIYSHWSEGKHRVMAQLPTGAGKTILFGEIIQEFASRGGRVLVLAHRIELVLQAAQKVSAIAQRPVGIIKAGICPDYSLPIQIASVQSLVNRLSLLEQVDLVVIDEAHHTTANTYRKIIAAYPEAYLLGVTATPIRLDGTGFRDLFDELVCGVTVKELIKLSHLAKFKLFADPNPMTTKGVKQRGGDYSSSQIAKANDIVELSGNLVDSYRLHAEGKRCVVFAVNVAHSIAIAERYTEAGIKAAHLDGNSPEWERRQVLEQFVNSEIQVISNCQLFDEGLDIPSLEAVQIAKPTASLSRWLQMVGRSLRPAPGKEAALIIDHTKNWAIHGLPTRGRVWTLDGVEQEAQRLQYDCESGEVIEVVIEVKPTSLTEIEVNEDNEWKGLLEQLIAHQIAYNYQPGWVYYKLLELRPPLKIWQAYGQIRGYKPLWAKYRYQEQEQHGSAS